MEEEEPSLAPGIGYAADCVAVCAVDPKATKGEAQSNGMMHSNQSTQHGVEEETDITSTGLAGTAKSSEVVLPAPLKAKNNLLAFFGGLTSNTPSEDDTTKPVTRRPKRKTAAASDALTQLQLGALKRALVDDSSMEGGPSSEAGPSTMTNGWKLAQPSTNASPAKAKAARKRKPKDDEDAEVSSMSAANGKKGKGKAMSDGTASKVGAGVKKVAGKKGKANAIDGGAEELDMIDPDLEMEDSYLPPTPKRGRKRKSDHLPTDRTDSSSRPPNGIIDVSQDSPTGKSPRKRLAKPKAKATAKVKAKAKSKAKQTKTKAEQEGTVSGSGTILDDDSDDDEIEVLRESMIIDDSSPVQEKPNPKKSMWTGRPAHPFFGGPSAPAPVTAKATQTTNEQEMMNDVVRDPDAQEEPELPESPTRANANPIVSASPVKPVTKVRKPVHPGRAMHGFFGGGGGAGGGSDMDMIDEGGGASWVVKQNGWGTGVEAEVARYPDEEEQHVGTDGESGRAGMGSTVVKRARQRMTPSVEDTAFWSRIYTRTISPDMAQDVGQDPAPPACREPNILLDSHPAISRITDGLVARFNNESWVERYRPTIAAEVLGNERQAGYLVDWMKELEIGSGSVVSQPKRNVIRKVHHGGRVRLAKDQDWIVDDSLDPIEDYAQDESMPSEPPTPTLPLDTPYPPFSSRLANSILLTGPTGSGKTAAVHAAASELAWEVFEVYPGIGKRSGEALRMLVGDVGKNHMVGKAHGGGVPASPQPVKEKKNGIGGFFGKKTAETAVQALEEQVETDIDLTRRESVIGFIEVEDDGAVPTSITSHAKGKFRQSLILLEEVDVLYKEDPGFWQGVVGLIAESKRPVVMTCNNISTIPLSELPLQTQLSFTSPPADLASTYLSAVAEHEDIIVSTSYLERLAQSKTSGRTEDLQILGDKPLPPGMCIRMARHDGGVDLRACLAQMQYDLTGGEAKSCIGLNGTCNTMELKDVFGIMQRRSYADAYLGQRSNAQLDANEIDRMHPTDDDEMAATTEQLMRKSRPRDIWPALTAYTREEDFVNALTDGHGSSEPYFILPRSRYLHNALAFLDALIPLDGYLLPHPATFLDLIPAVQWMVSIDDALQYEDKEREAKGEERVNRKTGRMMRLGGAGVMAYERQLFALDEEELSAVRRSRMAPVQVTE